MSVGVTQLGGEGARPRPQQRVGELHLSEGLHGVVSAELRRQPAYKLIRGQHSGHVISLDQSEDRIQVT